MLALVVAASLVQVADFGANPGALDMYEYVPADLPAGAPLVVALHGCTQTAADYDAAGWNALADTQHFAVLYPQQRTANQPLRCFDWYEPATEKAEAQSILAMIDHAIAAHGVDRAHVYVTGLSAGGAFTATLMAMYPDRFVAGSIMSGIAYGCATDLTTGQQCQQGATKTPKEWGDLVRAADPGFAGPWPRVQIWQGDKDTVVAPANAQALVAQWTDVHGAAQTATATETLATTTHTHYGDAVELYLVGGMDHAVAIGGTGCPAHTAMYFEDHGVCSTQLAATWFGLAGAGSGSGSGSGSGTDTGGGGGGCTTTGDASLGAMLLMLVIPSLRWGARSRMRCRRRCRSV